MAFKLVSLACILLCVVPLIDAANFAVNVTEFAFVPSTLQIAVGDTVTWTLVGQYPHSVTQQSAPGACSALAGGFATAGPTQTTGTFSQTFTANANIYYYCIPHCVSKNMQASIIVGTGSTTATTHVVTVGSPENAFAFVPATLTVNVGDTVSFNLVNGTHNVVSVSTTGAGSCAAATSPALVSQQYPAPMNSTAYNVTFTAAQTYVYMCSYHCLNHGMNGTIQVVVPGSTTTTTPQPGTTTHSGALAAQSTIATLITIAVAVALMQRA